MAPWSLVLVAAVGLVFPLRASAYLNPDTGSMLLQALLGGAAGLAVFGRLLWRRAAALFGRGERPPSQD
jgi:hypothetical protein